MNKIWLPIIFAIIGYLVSTRLFIKFLNTLNPIEGLLVYYIAIISTIIILSYLGLMIAGIHFQSFKQYFGLLILNFSIFLVLIWTNCYTATLIRGNCNGFTKTYLNTESGAVYFFWSHFFKKINTRRILTFVITPMVLSFIGIYLIIHDN